MKQVDATTLKTANQIGTYVLFHPRLRHYYDGQNANILPINCQNCKHMEANLLLHF